MMGDNTSRIDAIKARLDSADQTDAEFIANAPSDVQYLLDELQEYTQDDVFQKAHDAMIERDDLRAKLATAQAEIERLRDALTTIAADGDPEPMDLDETVTLALDRWRIETTENDALRRLSKKADAKLAIAVDALDTVANDGSGKGMGGGLRRDGEGLRDIARDALAKIKGGAT